MRNKLMVLTLVILMLLSLVLVADKLQVRCDVVDRVGNQHNCTGWTGWYEF